MDISSEVSAIISQASAWNFVGDCSLLELMKRISKNMDEHATQTITAMQQLELDAELTGIGVDNVNNSLRSLHNGNQFVEFRVEEDDETDIKCVNAPPKNEENPITDEEFDAEFIKNNMLMFRKHYEPVTIDVADSDDENNITTTVVYRAKNPYDNHSLPYIIGSKKWKENWHVGLLESDNDYSCDERSEAFSETSSSDGNNTRYQDESYESANATNLSDWASSTSLSIEKSNIVQNPAAATAAHPLFTKTNSTTTKLIAATSSSINNNQNTAELPYSDHQSVKRIEKQERAFQQDLFSAMRNTPPSDNSPTASFSAASLALPNNQETPRTRKASLISSTISSIDVKQNDSVSQNSFFDDDVDNNDNGNDDMSIKKVEETRIINTSAVSRIKRKPVNLFDDDDFNSLMSDIIDKAHAKSDNSNRILNQIQSKAVPEQTHNDEIILPKAGNSTEANSIPKTNVNSMQEVQTSSKHPEPLITHINLFDDSPPPILENTNTKNNFQPHVAVKGLFDDDFFEDFEDEADKAGRPIFSSFDKAIKLPITSSTTLKTGGVLSLFDDDDDDDDINYLFSKKQTEQIHKRDSFTPKSYLFDDEANDHNLFGDENVKQRYNDTPKPNVQNKLQEIEAIDEILDPTGNVEKASNLDNENYNNERRTKQKILKNLETQSSSTTTKSQDNLFDIFNEPIQKNSKAITQLYKNGKNSNNEVSEPTLVVQNEAKIVSTSSDNYENEPENFLKKVKAIKTTTNNSEESSTSTETGTPAGYEPEDVHNAIKDSVQSLERNTTNIFEKNSILESNSISLSKSEHIPNAVAQKSSEAENKNDTNEVTKLVQSQNYANVFLDEPPDDSEFFKTLNGTLTTSKIFDLENDYFEPALPAAPSNVKQTEPHISSDYSGLRLFSEIPPDDDEELGAKGGFKIETPNNPEIYKSNTENSGNRVHKIFYDDFSETATAPASTSSGESETLKNKEESTPEIDADVVDRSVKAENNKFKAPPVNKLKIPKMNINVQALLPSSGAIPKIKKSQEPITKRPSNLSDDAEKAVSNTCKSKSLHSETSSNENLLSSVCKTRVRVPATRRPSTRHARQENYRKSLLEEQQEISLQHEENQQQKSQISNKQSAQQTIEHDISTLVPSAVTPLPNLSEIVTSPKLSQILEPSATKKPTLQDDNIEKSPQKQPPKQSEVAKPKLTASFLDSEDDDDDDWFSKSKTPGSQTTQTTKSASTTVKNEKHTDFLQIKSFMNSDNDDEMHIKSNTKSQIASRAPLESTSSREITTTTPPKLSGDIKKHNVTVISSLPPPLEDEIFKKITNKPPFKSFLDSDDDEDMLFKSTACATNPWETTPYQGFKQKTISETNVIGSSQPNEDDRKTSVNKIASLPLENEIFKNPTSKPAFKSFLDSEDEDDNDLFSSIQKQSSRNVTPASAAPLTAKPSSVVTTATIPSVSHNMKTKDSLFTSDDDSDSDFLSVLSTTKTSKKQSKNTLKAQPVSAKSLFSDGDSDDGDDLFGRANIRQPIKRIQGSETKSTASNANKPNQGKAPVADNPLADLLDS